MKKVLLVILVVLAGCAQSEHGTGIDGRESVSDAALHALMAQRIEELYQRIEVLAFDQNRTLPELDQDRRRAAGEIANSASNLSSIATELMQLSESLDLTESNRQQFQALSQNLQSASNEVRSAAADASFQDLANSVTRLQGTCTACHSLYRGR
jgi:cytochrome c556